MYLQLKRANSDDALTKPATGAAASGYRMKKTVTTGAISDLAEARPRSTSGRRDDLDHITSISSFQSLGIV